MAIVNNKVVSRQWDVVFDGGRHPRGKIGFVLLATEQTVMDDVMTLIPDGIGVHFARVNNPDEINRETLAAIAPDLVKTAARGAERSGQQHHRCGGAGSECARC